MSFFGGPLDGTAGPKKIINHPGQMPLFEYTSKRQKYVYQARVFAEDFIEKQVTTKISHLPMDFVQVISLDESAMD